MRGFSFCLSAGGLLLHLHHRTAGPRQVRGVPEEQLQTPAAPGQPESLQVLCEGRLAEGPDGRAGEPPRHRGHQRYRWIHLTHSLTYLNTYSVIMQPALHLFVVYMRVPEL